MRKLITVGMTSFCLAFTMPMATWADNIEKTVTTAQFENALPYVTDIAMKYANAPGVNIISMQIGSKWYAHKIRSDQWLLKQCDKY
ncbi:hypothetical protein [Lacrimispora sp.]|uniref:hypothetical protein n=1 Tax=Lacrimispora sp. TaxID=2719234 RepID=UPI0028A9A654|nr:hypothetical protein [Lacrimispora sp.]